MNNAVKEFIQILWASITAGKHLGQALLTTFGVIISIALLIAFLK